MIHVAILKPGYIHAILAGRKTIESRLTKTMQPPHGCIETGERLFLKASGGPFMATAIADEVITFRNLDQAAVQGLRDRYNAEIAGEDAYWQLKQDSRFATLVRLLDVEPIDVGPAYKVAYMKAWYVLDEKVSPILNWEITAGALRNHYAMLPTPDTAEFDHPVMLELPDGRDIQTRVALGRRLRWRGWGPVYDQAGAKPGDVLRYIAVGPRQYKVRFISR